MIKWLHGGTYWRVTIGLSSFKDFQYVTPTHPLAPGWTSILWVNIYDPQIISEFMISYDSIIVLYFNGLYTFHISPWYKNWISNWTLLHFQVEHWKFPREGLMQPHLITPHMSTTVLGLGVDRRTGWRKTGKAMVQWLTKACRGRFHVGSVLGWAQFGGW